MNNFGHICLFSLLIFQFGFATVIITEIEPNEPSLNNETVSASSCYCNCAPVITVSCPAAPPSCPTPTDPPITPTVTDPITSTTGSIMSSSTINPTTSSPVTDPLTTMGSTSTVTIITSTDGSSSSTTSQTSSSSTSPSFTTTETSPSSTISSSPSSTLTGSSSTSSNMTTSPVSSTSTILTTFGTPPPSNATSTSTQQSSISTGGTSSTTQPSKNCSAVLYSDSGWFTSPNYPDNYDNNLDCNWLINVTDKIVLNFESFVTESDSDYVSVYDGPTAASQRLLYTSGSTIPPPINSSGGQMLITFETDSSNIYKGFVAAYYPIISETSSSSPTTSTLSTTTIVDGSTKSTLSTDPDFTRPTTSGPILDNCQAILEGDSGTFSSPYYPQNYPNNANCSWIITASDRVTITFNQFRTEPDTDVIKIYDGPTTSYTRLLIHSGTSIPSPVLSSRSQVLITFFSDGSVNDIGFNASYSLYIPPTTTLPPYYYCGENITDATSGFITSPNFPDGYPAYSRCTWIVQTAPGTRIQFHFTDFSTKSGDYVTVYGSKSCTSYPVIKQSGNVSSICGFISNGNSLKITFGSEASSSALYPGFRASFTTEHGCGGTLNSTNQGTIMSPGYDINGTFTYSCTWKLGVNQGSKLNFSMSEMIGSASPLMNFYDGFEKSYLLASGIPTPSFFAISKSNEALLEIMSYTSSSISSCLACSSSSCSTNAVCDANSVVQYKWKGLYSATTDPAYGCHGSMNTDTRTVTSPGYPTTYTQRNLQCNWKIEEPAGKKLQLVFPVPVSLYRSDTLTISNPPWTLTINGGTVNPAPVEIGSNETSLKFSTASSIDNSSLFSGWKINWNAVSSP